MTWTGWPKAAIEIPVRLLIVFSICGVGLGLQAALTHGFDMGVAAVRPAFLISVLGGVMAGLAMARGLADSTELPGKRLFLPVCVALAAGLFLLYLAIYLFFPGRVGLPTISLGIMGVAAFITILNRLLQVR